MLSLCRQGLLEWDTENSNLAGDDFEAGVMAQVLGSSITYRTIIGPQRGRKWNGYADTSPGQRYQRNGCR